MEFFLPLCFTHIWIFFPLFVFSIVIPYNNFCLFDHFILLLWDAFALMRVIKDERTMLKWELEIEWKKKSICWPIPFGIFIRCHHCLFHTRLILLSLMLVCAFVGWILRCDGLGVVSVGWCWYCCGFRFPNSLLSIAHAKLLDFFYKTQAHTHFHCSTVSKRTELNSFTWWIFICDLSIHQNL